MFWLLHSVWALATGAVVVVFAHDRFGFVPWVVVALALTWLSTLFFGTQADEPEGSAGAPGLGREVTSYITRVLYQETLFFLLPLYVASTVISSLNVLFPALLLVLAVLSCLDLLFDRWLRESPVFGLVFFATVAFAALNLLLPLLAGLDPELATPTAALLSVGSAVPLAWKATAGDAGARVRLGLAAAGFLGLAVGLARMVPPVPLRLEEARFAAGIERSTLALRGPLDERVSTARAPGSLVVLVEVFAPVRLPTRVALEWRRDGVLLRTSREVELVAHEGGFRVWDGWRSGAAHAPAGHYEVTARTRGGRVFGRVGLDVRD